MKTCVVTCTGSRPELFALCQRWVTRCDPDLWIVRNDTRDVMAAHRVDSAHASLTQALNAVPNNHHVIIMEDDDWYPASHVRALSDTLNQGCDLAGPNVEIKYNVPGRLWSAGPVTRALAGRTAIHANALARYIGHLSGPRGGDELAWQRMRGALLASAYCVEIKGAGFGLPGRPGATAKHDPQNCARLGWTPDPDATKLRELIGDDAEEYLKLCTRKPTDSSKA